MFNLSLPQVAATIAEHWGLAGAQVQPAVGGMTSLVWSVEHPRGHYVAKAVPVGAAGEFAAGLAIASRLERAGIAAGAPLPAVDGELTVVGDGWVLALLRRVRGTELTGETEDELRLIGRTLGAVHRALGGIDPDDGEGASERDGGGEGKGGWPDLNVRARHLGVRPWVRPVVEAGVLGVRQLGLTSLTWGFVHGDPAPEAFLLDADTGTCGLIDWGASHTAPLLYDLASAVMYAGGPGPAAPLIEAYCAAGAGAGVGAGPVSDDEVARGLLPLLDYRWALQAHYFAYRIAKQDMTGIDSPAENDKGLEDARVWWAGRAPGLFA
jgi:homoserine kinase type II